MHDIWTDRLSAWLDDDLTPAERVEMERHLLDCAACREGLQDLQAIVAAARQLPDQPPTADLWPGVAAAIGAGGSRVSWPVAIAAGVLLAVTSALSAWVMIGAGGAAATGEAIATRPPAMLQPIANTSAPYGAAIEDLLDVLERRRDRLDPRTVAVVEGSLATIDRAIAEATAALEAEPGDVSLASHIAGQRQLKLAVLRQVEKLTAGEP